MSDKSFVTFAQHVCVVCGKTFDTNELLLDRRMRNTFEMHTVTGFGMCPACNEKKEQGYVAVVAVDPAKSSGFSGTNVQPGDVYRTGRIAHIKETAWPLVFNVPVPKNGVCFIDDEAMNKIERMHATIEDGRK